jgi:hypothetical protein
MNCPDKATTSGLRRLKAAEEGAVRKLQAQFGGRMENGKYCLSIGTDNRRDHQGYKTDGEETSAECNRAAASKGGEYYDGRHTDLATRTLRRAQGCYPCADPDAQQDEERSYSTPGGATTQGDATSGSDSD